MNIEPLESRIAPASLTFTDVDGDKVVITTSGSGTLTLGGNVTVTNGQLEFLDLTDAAFRGANVSIVATRDPVAGGDGRVNVGNLTAAGNDLGAVMVDGDLGLLAAGSGTDPVRGVSSLSVGSLGRFGTSTGAIFVIVTVMGKLGSLKVQSDVVGTEISASSIGLVKIGGSLIGGPTDNDGLIFSTGDIGKVIVGGDLVGGAGNGSGTILSFGTIAGVTVGGSLRGGANPGTGDPELGSGAIVARGKLGPVKIAGEVRGGGGAFSGAIFSGTQIVSASLGGSLIGGAGNGSGTLRTDGALGSVTIGGSVVGGSNPGGGDPNGSGAIRGDASIGAIKITGDLHGGTGSFSGRIASDGKIASVTLGGSLLIGPAGANGGIFAGFPNGAIGPIKIGGDVSGSIFGQKLAAVTVGGSVIGGALGGGSIQGDEAVGAIFIGGSVIGGGAVGSGVVGSNDDGPVASVTIRGSLIGGTNASRNAMVITEGALGPVKIGGDIVGGNITINGTASNVGCVLGQRIASVLVGGSIIAGLESNGGNYETSGAIRATDALGPVTVKGSLIGNSANPVLITARQATPGTPSFVAIKSLTVGGRVEFAAILAGYSDAPTPVGVNGDAQVGPITVDGDWIASRLAVGTNDGSDDLGGTADDFFLGGGVGTVLSKIASLAIKGQALGTIGGADSFRFMAEKIGAFKIGGAAIPLPAGANDLPIGITGDLRIRDNA